MPSPGGPTTSRVRYGNCWRGVSSRWRSPWATWWRKSARLGLSTPLCDNLLAMMLDLESGKRQLGLHNYAELAACRT